MWLRLPQRPLELIGVSSKMDMHTAGGSTYHTMNKPPIFPRMHASNSAQRTFRLTVAMLAVAFVPKARSAAAGDLDSLNAPVFGDRVEATAVQPDGKTIIAGSFSSVLGVPRNNIARLNADGTLDTGFNPNPNAFGYISSVALQSDGKVLLGGNFTTLQPNDAPAATERSYIARVYANGTLDISFDPKPNATVYSVAVQADGKVLLGGHFTALRPNGAAYATARRHIARVNPDGTLDNEFDPNASSDVSTVAVQADGKVLLGGGFHTLQPKDATQVTTRNNIARVNANGSLDAGFNPNANSYIHCVAVQADGRVLLGGYFTALQPNGAALATTRSRIARVNGDGTLDTGFDPKANNFVLSLAVQADGKVLLAGGFNTLQPNGAASAIPRNRIARVDADGTLDSGFNPNPNGVAYSVAAQADGKVLLGGEFTALQPNGSVSATSRNLFARLVNDPATQSLTAQNAGQVSWTRGGSSPELGRVTFDLSTDNGATWNALGASVRVGTTPNWELTGLALPASGQLRARGATRGGSANGTSGLIQTVASFSGLTPFPYDIAVTGNSVTIIDGDSTPSTADHTDFGSVNVNESPLVGTFYHHQ